MAGATMNIRKKYGGNSRQSMNRAIRAEFSDGKWLLNRMHKLYENYKYSCQTKSFDDNELSEKRDKVKQEFVTLQKRKNEMVKILRKKYED